MTVEATDSDGDTLDATILVIVTPVPQAPYLVAPPSSNPNDPNPPGIPDQTITSNQTAPTSLDLWNYFNDRADKTYLTYTMTVVDSPYGNLPGGPTSVFGAAVHRRQRFPDPSQGGGRRRRHHHSDGHRHRRPVRRQHVHRDGVGPRARDQRLLHGPGHPGSD